MRMNDGYSAIRAVAGISIVMSCVFWGLSQRADGDSPGAVSGPEELRGLLWRAQEGALPSDEFPVMVDAGELIYEGSGRGAATLADGLVPVGKGDGGSCWPVTLYEDPLTFETVYLNAFGDEAFRLLPPDGYDPFRVAVAAFRDGCRDGIDLSAYSPSRVVMTARLLAPESLEPLMPELSGRIGTEALNVGSAAQSGAHGSGTSAAVTDAPDVNDDGAVNGQERGGASDGEEARVSVPLPVQDGSDGCEVVFVDSRAGNDRNTGRDSAAETFEGGGQGDGPKKTIGGGLDAVKDGGWIIVHDGEYAENLDVRGRNVSVRIDGVVKLNGKLF